VHSLQHHPPRTYTCAHTEHVKPQMCLLPNTGLYSKCPTKEEEPYAQHYEALYRAPFFYDYDVTGAPIKSYNERFPQPPLEFPKRVPQPGT
jgi:hypothetical protein